MRITKIRIKSFLAVVALVMIIGALTWGLGLAPATLFFAGVALSYWVGDLEIGSRR